MEKDEIQSNQWVARQNWPYEWQRKVAELAAERGLHVDWYVWAVKHGTVYKSGDVVICKNARGELCEWYKDQVFRRFKRFFRVSGGAAVVS